MVVSAGAGIHPLAGVLAENRPFVVVAVAVALPHPEEVAEACLVRVVVVETVHQRRCPREETMAAAVEMVPMELVEERRRGREVPGRLVVATAVAESCVVAAECPSGQLAVEVAVERQVAVATGAEGLLLGHRIRWELAVAA